VVIEIPYLTYKSGNDQLINYGALTRRVPMMASCGSGVWGRCQQGLQPILN